jgi:hypothetical protein
MTDAPRRSDTPTPGYYLMRLVKNGPLVGCAIERTAEGWRVMKNGEWQGPSDDPWILPFMHDVHHFAEMSTEAEVRYRIGLKRYEEIYRPDGAAANPRRAINRDKALPF